MPYKKTKLVIELIVQSRIESADRHKGFDGMLSAETWVEAGLNGPTDRVTAKVLEMHDVTVRPDNPAD